MRLGGPCASLHRSGLAQSGAAGVLSSKFVALKTPQLSPRTLDASPRMALRRASWAVISSLDVSATCGVLNSREGVS